MALPDYTGFEDDDWEEERRRAAAAAPTAVSTSPSTVTDPKAFDPTRVKPGGKAPIEWAEDFIRRNPGDYHRIEEGYASETEGGRPKGSSVTSEWTSAPSSSSGPSSDAWYAPWFEEFRNELSNSKRESKAKADSLYDTLMQRINKSEEIDKDNPIIAGQTSTFRSSQHREMNKYLADLAERSGPYANLRGEQRMAAGKVAQNTAAFEAQLLADELRTERERIDAALSGALGIVTAEQARELQREAMVLDQMAAEAGIELSGRSLDLDWNKALMGNDYNLRRLGLEEWDRGMYYDLLQQGAFD